VILTQQTFKGISVDILPAKREELSLSYAQTQAETMKQKNNNRYKQIFMADKGYDSKDILKILKKKGYKPIIPQNLRNIKNPKLIRKMYAFCIQLR